MPVPVSATGRGAAHGWDFPLLGLVAGILCLTVGAVGPLIAPVFVHPDDSAQRLLELTDKRVKPAVYFGGKARIIDFALSNALNSGIRKMAIATQFCFEAKPVIAWADRLRAGNRRERGQDDEGRDDPLDLGLGVVGVLGLGALALRLGSGDSFSLASASSAAIP